MKKLIEFPQQRSRRWNFVQIYVRDCSAWDDQQVEEGWVWTRIAANDDLAEDDIDFE